jgi:zinc transport system substrate-binding protein
MRLDLMKPSLVLAAGVVAAVTLSACGGTDDGQGTTAVDAGAATDDAASAPAGEPALQVAAGFYPLEFLVREVGGERVETVDLTPPGAEAHDLELTADSLVTLTDADLLVYLETFQPAVDDAVASRSGPSLDLGSVATREYAEGEGDSHDHGGEEDHAHEGEETHAGEDEHAHGATDPHFWTDPTVMAQAAEVVREALTEADPDGAADYAANTEALVAELETLDTTAREALTACEVTTLVTAHDAFGYFADRYGFESAPISGLSPEDEPSPAELAAITDLVNERGVSTVYTETLIPTDLADTVAAETGAATAVLDPVEGITDDSPGDDYLSVMEANIATVADGQRCG